MIAPRALTVCTPCGYRGYRVAREGDHRYGVCQICGRPVQAAPTHQDRRAARAKQELEELSPTKSRAPS